MEFGIRVNDLLEIVEEDADTVLTDEQSMVVDIVEAINLIADDGLHELWQSSLDIDNVTKYIDEVGAHEIADHIRSSQWCLSAPEDRSDFNETEESHLSEIEQELDDRLGGIVSILEEFLEE